MVFFYIFLASSYFLNYIGQNLFKNNFLNFFEKNTEMVKYLKYKTDLSIEFNLILNVPNYKNNDAEALRHIEGALVEPLTFRDAYLNYSFFLENELQFDNSLKILKKFFNCEDLFLNFFFFYIFINNRFGKCTAISYKNEKCFNDNFGELFFLCFYFLPKTKINNVYHFSNNYLYILKNITKLIKLKSNNISNLNILVNNTFNNNKLHSYSLLLNKFKKLDNLFLNNKIMIILNFFFEKKSNIIILNNNLKKN
jgi:hypothetical protein